MVEVTYEIKGRQITLDQFGDAVDRAIVETATAHLQQQLRDVRCPEDNVAPRLIARGKSAATLKWDVDGCCAKLNKLVQSKVKEGLSHG